jgi:uncharacterized protein
MLPIVSVAAAILAFVYIVLSVHTISSRRNAGHGLGDGGSNTLQRAIRAHGNFAEYTPLALILMALVEVQNGNMYVLVLLASAFVLGRLSHAYGLIVAETKPKSVFFFRVAGMAATFTVLGTLAVMLLIANFL